MAVSNRVVDDLTVRVSELKAERRALRRRLHDLLNGLDLHRELLEKNVGPDDILWRDIAQAHLILQRSRA